MTRVMVLYNWLVEEKTWRPSGKLLPPSGFPSAGANIVNCISFWIKIQDIPISVKNMYYGLLLNDVCLGITSPRSTQSYSQNSIKVTYYLESVCI